MRVPKSLGKVDFSGLLPEFGRLSEQAEVIISEAVNDMLGTAEFGGLHVFLPALYEDSLDDGLGHPRPDDPLTIYVGLPFSDDHLGPEMPICSFLLDDLIDDEFFDNEFSKSGGLAAARLSSALRLLADEVDRKARCWAESGEWPDESASEDEPSAA